MENTLHLDKIKKMYLDDEVCMAELLASTKCDSLGDLSIEQAFDLYVNAKFWADGDRFYLSQDDGSTIEKIKVLKGEK